MCGEGGCGACTVMVSKYIPDRKQIVYPLLVFVSNDLSFSIPVLSHGQQKSKLRRRTVTWNVVIHSGELRQEEHIRISL